MHYRSHNSLATFLILMTFAAAMPNAILAQAAPGPTVLYSFAGGSDGYGPIGKMVSDPQGNFYGVTSEGGTGNPNCATLCGTVFEISHTGDTWIKTTIYNFVGGNDGYFPEAGLIMDKAGNLYGTTYFGGGPRSEGTVFELKHTAHGWREEIIHRFNTIEDGAWPSAGLVFDPRGNLYGTTLTGGKANGGYGGTVFELLPGPTGWSEHVLHSFTGPGDGDGAFPEAGVALDRAGNVYGTAALGGTSTTCAYSFGCGIVFELSANADGTWSESVLHNFASSDGASPATTPVLVSGNLYGATVYGGDGPSCGNGCGVFYELTPNGDGSWTDTTLYQFAGGLTDGGNPISDFAVDQSGNFYGTTYDGGGGGTGGPHQCQFDSGWYCGAAYELSPSDSGWTEKVVASFSKGNGSEPVGIAVDPAGRLYGTAFFGGNGSAGVVYEVVP